MSEPLERALDFAREHGVTLIIAVIVVGGIALKMRDPWANTTRVETEPRQGELMANPASWPHEGAVLTEVATWELDAVILHTEWYRFDHFGDVVPLDLALGWGPMSDPDVLRELKIAQRNRWYWVRWDHPLVYSEEELMGSSSNVHILPADADVMRAVRSFDQGDNVHLSGRLVDVSYDGQVMSTSRTREDRGGGACEVFYVENAQRR